MKTICIYYSRDLDGWMSAAIVKKWFINNNNNIIGCADNSDILYNLKNRVYLNFLGWDYGDPIPDLSEYDKVIMCDISFPVDEMVKLNKKFLYDDFIWLDHHISAIKALREVKFPDNMHLDDIVGLRDTEFAACELTWKYFFPDETML